jgi:hypothetical protein
MDAFTPHQLGREVADAEVPEEATVPVASLSLGRLEEMFGAGKKAFANGVEMAAYFSASTLTPWERFAWTRGWIFAQVEHESRTQTQITRSVQRGRAELLDALKRIGIERDVAGVADVVVPRLDWDCLRETWQRVRANRNVFPVEEKTTVSAAETQIQTPASAPDDSKYFATLVDVGQCLARLPRVRKTATEFGTYVVPMYDWNALFVQIANALGKIERSLGAPVIDVQETAAPPETPVPATALASLETEEAMRRLFTAARAIACKRHNLANPKGAIWVAHAWWLPLAEAVSEIETKGLFSLNGRSQSPMQSPLAPEA